MAQPQPKAPSHCDADRCSTRRFVGFRRGFRFAKKFQFGKKGVSKANDEEFCECK
jgi:hypothetical protein